MPPTQAQGVAAKSAALPLTERMAKWCVVAVIVNCTVQVAWFSEKCFNDVNFDGIDYMGIARHVAEGNFHASINAFRSALLSWLIAAASLLFSGHHLLLVGKIVSVGCFLATVALTYVLAFRLWHSALAAGVAALWFSLARGLIPNAVFGVNADFLLTALVLVYFVLLLDLLRLDRTRAWFWLGGVHAIAYLAKAIALPWLAVSTGAAAVLFSGGSWKRKGVRLAAAGLAPLLAVCVWGTVLHSKYGLFTAGSQFKTNLFQWTLKQNLGFSDAHYLMLRDTSEFLDAYMVNDPMPPKSPAWHYHLRASQVLPSIFRAEAEKLPMAAKEIAISVTPGGLLALFLVLVALRQHRNHYPAEFRFAIIIVVSAGCLVAAYCMLAFDARYIYPVIPLFITLSVRALFTAQKGDCLEIPPPARRTAQLLLIAGLVFGTVYWASPFRTLARDFQLSCVDAAYKMHFLSRPEIVSIGEGPFPEHGVGWEAGYIAAFLGGERIVATLDHLPDSAHLEGLLSDLHKANPAGVIVWGKPTDAAYNNLCRRLLTDEANTKGVRVDDPRIGEVGRIFFWPMPPA